MESPRWMGNQKRMGRWEIRNARNAGIKIKKKTQKKKEMKGLKGEEKNKEGMEALQGPKG